MKISDTCNNQLERLREAAKTDPVARLALERMEAANARVAENNKELVNTIFSRGTT